MSRYSWCRYYPIYGSCGKPINSEKTIDLDWTGLNETTGSSQPGINTPLMNINTSNLQRACNRAVTLCGTSNFSCIRDRFGNLNAKIVENMIFLISFGKFPHFKFPCKEFKACNGNQNSMETTKRGRIESAVIQLFYMTLLLTYSSHVIQPWPVTWATI